MVSGRGASLAVDRLRAAARVEHRAAPLARDRLHPRVHPARWIQCPSPADGGLVQLSALCSTRRRRVEFDGRDAPRPDAPANAVARRPGQGRCAASPAQRVALTRPSTAAVTRRSPHPGSRTVARRPPKGLRDSTRSPPWPRATSRAMARPRPTPPAVLVARAVQPAEGAQRFGVALGGDARAVVVHVDLQRARGGAPRRHRHARAVGDGVRHEVGQGPPQRHRPHGGDQARGRLAGHVRAAAGGPVAHLVEAGARGRRARPPRRPGRGRRPGTRRSCAPSRAGRRPCAPPGGRARRGRSPA